MTDQPEILMVDEAAAFLRCSDTHIRNLIARGRLPAFNLGLQSGKDYRIKREDLDKLLVPAQVSHASVPPPVKSPVYQPKMRRLRG